MKKCWYCGCKEMAPAPELGLGNYRCKCGATDTELPDDGILAPGRPIRAGIPWPTGTPSQAIMSQATKARASGSRSAGG